MLWAAKTVIKSFKKCSISNSLDGEEDDMLWNDSDKETNVESPTDKANATSGSEADPYDDLFLTEQQDFKGF